MAKRGPKPKWTAETLAPIFAGMTEGQSLLAVCKQLGANYRGVWTAIHLSDELTAMYTRAKRDYIHARVASMDEIATSEKDVQRARLRCDNIKWEAARVMPKDYGDKQQIEHGGNVAVSIVDYAAE